MLQRRNQRQKRAHRPMNQPLTLEVLEDRTLPSATPTTLLDLNGLAVDPNQFRSSDILVRFQAPPGSPNGPSLAAGTTLAGALPLVSGLYEVNVPKGMTVAHALAAYRAERGVLSAEPDYQLSISAVPNDPLLNQQYALHNTGQNGGTPGADIHATDAWNVASGSPNIVVAVMDTGIDYDHPDLYQNIWINQAEIPDQWYTKSSANGGYDKLVYKWQIKTETPGVITFRDLNNLANRGLVWDNNGDGRIDAADLLRPVSQGGWMSGSTKDGDTAHPDDFFGWNFVSNTNDPLDDNGHGTHVSGILGAAGNNGAGIAGVDWNVPIMPVKFIGSDGVGSISNFIQGLNYAVRHGAKITNNSWDGAPASQSLYDAINNARSNGQIFVAAAGNQGGSNDSNPDYPASYSQSLNNVVAVAATDNRDQLAGFSDYGPRSVALAAPGVDILSTLPGGSYGQMSGTSMATPEVTGALALVWGEHPNWSYTQVINQVLSTVDKLPSLQGQVASGGRLDVAAALARNQSTVTRTTPVVTSVSAQGQGAGSMDRLQLTFNVPINVNSFSASAIRLTDPNGRLIPVTVRAVDNSGGRQALLLFANQTAAGNYRLSINSSVHDLQGGALQPYQSVITLQSPRKYTNNKTTAIKPRAVATSSITVPDSTTIGHVQVRVTISFPTDGDLYLRLTSPHGTNLLLVGHIGGAGADFKDTVFDDSAPAVIYAKPPFNGWFHPEWELANLIGQNAAGNWTLSIQDVGGHSGALLNWSLVLTPANSAPSVAQISSVAAASGASAAPTPIAATPPNPGTTATPSNALAPSNVSVSSPPVLPTPRKEENAAAQSLPNDHWFSSPSVLEQMRTGLLVGKRSPNSFVNGRA